MSEGGDSRDGETVDGGNGPVLEGVVKVPGKLVGILAVLKL